MSDDLELCAVAARVRELKIQHAHAVVADMLALKTYGRMSEERAASLAKIQHLVAEIKQAKHEAAKTRASARTTRCDAALNFVRAIVRNDSHWTPEAVDMTRRLLREQTVDVFTDLPASVQASMSSSSASALALALPVLPPALSLRAALVSAGMLKEAPAIAVPPPAPKVKVVESEPRQPRPVFEPRYSDPQKIGPCGKRVFTSKHAARDANKSARFRFRPYPCEECNGGWHVANGDKR